MIGLQGNDEQKAEGRQVLADVLEALRIVAILISPLTPRLACAMYTQLGFSEEQFQDLSLADAAWGGVPMFGSAYECISARRRDCERE